MRSWACWLAVGLAACAGEPDEVRPDDTDTPGTGSACGVEPVPGVVMDFIGRATDTDGAPAAGATVVLRDLGLPGNSELGRTVAGDDGAWRLDDVTFTAWPDCWAFVTEFTVTGFLDGLTGSLPITADVGDAWLNDATVVDLLDDPIVLRDAVRAGSGSRRPAP